MNNVSRGTRGTLSRPRRRCSKCGKRWRRPKQRWCRTCHREYAQKNRADLKARRIAQAWENAELRRRLRALAAPEARA